MIELSFEEKEEITVLCNQWQEAAQQLMTFANIRLTQKLST